MKSNWVSTKTMLLLLVCLIPCWLSPAVLVSAASASTASWTTVWVDEFQGEVRQTSLRPLINSYPFNSSREHAECIAALFVLAALFCSVGLPVRLVYRRVAGVRMATKTIA